MKINLSKSTFSAQIIIILIVLLVYTFYFVDEELLVSLMTTIVLVGVYNLSSASVNSLFMSNVNTVFQKFSIYILMNLSILNRLVLKFDTISLSNTYNVLYTVLLNRTISKLNDFEMFFVNSVNLLIQNIISYVLLNTTSKYYQMYLKSSLNNTLFNKNFSNSTTSKVKYDFIVAVSKLLLK
jgi:hypothetical protein